MLNSLTIGGQIEQQEWEDKFLGGDAMPYIAYWPQIQFWKLGSEPIKLGERISAVKRKIRETISHKW